MTARACILTTVHRPFDPRIFHKQARTLVQAGYEVILVAQHDGDAVVDGVRFVGLSKPRNRLERMFSLTWRAFRLALRHRADVYHFHDPELIPVGLVLRLLGKRVIYDVHEDYGKAILRKYWVPGPLRSVVAAAIRCIEKGSARAFDGVVAVGDTIARHFPQNKTVIVKNFPRLDLFLSQTAPAFSGAGRLIYVGGISEDRGAREMVAAVRMLDDFKDTSLLLIGKPSPIELLQELLASEGDSRVTYLGEVPHSDIPSLLSTAQVGLLVIKPTPAYVEAIPVKLFEYLAAGLPVIVSKPLHVSRIVEQVGCGLLVDPSDPAEIAQAARWLLNNPIEAKQMGQRGREYVRQHCSWDTEGAKLLSFYEHLLESR